MSSTRIKIEGRDYRVTLKRRVSAQPSAPRLVVVAYQPNELAQQVLRVCIQAIQRFTSTPYELWVVDNNSPSLHSRWLIECPDVNLVLSHTEPLPPGGRNVVSRLIAYLRGRAGQRSYGSYANAIGLELAMRFIDPACQYLMSLHMDTMACHPGWLSFLLAKVEGDVAAAGVRMDTTRTPEGVLHVLGFVVDYQRFRMLGLDYFPQLPRHDVGDRVTVELRRAGYRVFACRNTLWEPGLVEQIPVDSPMRSLPVDRSFDDEGNVIFLHLGRGIRKSSDGYERGMTAQEWVTFADRELLI